MKHHLMTIGLAAGLFGLLQACATPEPVAPFVQEAKLIKIGQLRLDDAGKPYWAFCNDKCPPPTAKTMQIVVSRPAAEGRPAMAQQVMTMNHDLLFAFDSATLRPEGQSALSALHATLSPDAQVAVIGHTDRLGSKEYNEALSKRRADAVRTFLLGLGTAGGPKLKPDAVTAMGRGESQPVTGAQCNNIQNRDALIRCLAPDRRVEVVTPPVAPLR